MRLIDADAIIATIEGDMKKAKAYEFILKGRAVIALIENQPTMDAVLTRHADWLEEPYHDNLITRRCSRCLNIALITTPDAEGPAYCHHCGAKMDGGEHEESEE